MESTRTLSRAAFHGGGAFAMEPLNGGGPVDAELGCDDVDEEDGIGVSTLRVLCDPQSVAGARDGRLGDTKSVKAASCSRAAFTRLRLLGTGAGTHGVDGSKGTLIRLGVSGEVGGVRLTGDRGGSAFAVEPTATAATARSYRSFLAFVPRTART